jgi:uroporphyrinogen-III decarboxylase
VRFRRTERIVERSGDQARVTYRTPVGSVSGVLRYDEAMRRDGITIMAVTERVVKSAEDLEVVACLFEDLEVEPDESRYRALCEGVGEAGLVVAFGSVAASPVHHLLKELVPYDQFYFELHDHPERIDRVARQMEGYYEALLQACVASSAEVVLFGANYDLMLTPPSVFEPHLLPTLTHWSDRLHTAGKLLLTHTDGENDRLLGLYRQAGVDVADSVCPRPMTRLSLQDYREAWGDRIAIWGGLCSVSVLPGSFSEEQFEAHLDEALAAAGDGRGLIFSLADTTPPEASLDRIRRIGERIEEWTP